MAYPIKLAPFVSCTIWGGRRLINEYGVKTDLANAAEAWVMSAHKNGSSVIENGEYAGKTLRELYLSDKSIVGKRGERFDDFPVLIKFIDAQDNLSIQVHPDDEYCAKKGSGAGKTECWYILDADEDAELILGFKDKITKEQFARSIEDDTVLDYVKHYKVRKGDFFFIDAGTLHAICKGVLLAEVQQNSDTTYRIYDYNRVQKDGSLRELHIENAKDVTLTEQFKEENYKPAGENDCYDRKVKTLVSTSMFTVNNLRMDGARDFYTDSESFLSVLILDGSGKLSYSDKEISFTKGDSFFVPASFGKFVIDGKTDLLLTNI